MDIKTIEEFVNGQEKSRKLQSAISNCQQKLNQFHTGTNKEEVVDEVIRFCVNSGYRDACRRFKGIKGTGVGEKVQKQICDFISARLKKESSLPISKTEWSDIQTSLSYASKFISFGGIQKIVNMAYKYMYCFSMKIDGFMSCSFFNNCVCPIDSFIILILLDECRRKKVFIPNDTQKILLGIASILGADKWSNLDLEKYIKVEGFIEQTSKDVFGCKNGLEFDLVYWRSLDDKQQAALQMDLKNYYKNK